MEAPWAGPAFCFPLDIGGDSGAVRVTEQNADVLRPHLEAWTGDVRTARPLFAVLHEGRAAAVCALGREPLYSTSWENAASRALAARLGLRRFGADLHID